jgi:hypothetical protein
MGPKGMYRGTGNLCQVLFLHAVVFLSLMCAAQCASQCLLNVVSFFFLSSFHAHKGPTCLGILLDDPTSTVVFKLATDPSVGCTVLKCSVFALPYTGYAQNTLDS